jgi:hypothetical protein
VTVDAAKESNVSEIGQSQIRLAAFLRERRRRGNEQAGNGSGESQPGTAKAIGARTEIGPANGARFVGFL